MFKIKRFEIFIQTCKRTSEFIFVILYAVQTTKITLAPTEYWYDDSDYSDGESLDDEVTNAPDEVKFDIKYQIIKLIYNLKIK